MLLRGKMLGRNIVCVFVLAVASDSERGTVAA